ncbi:MAG: Secretion system C-terminal sorting domain [Bacteroidota bacterium]
MKKIITLFFIALFISNTNAQTTYFSDTVYNAQLIYPGIGGNIIQSGNGYTITPVHYDYNLSLVKTDSLGNFQHSTQYILFGSHLNTFPNYNSNIQKRNKSWLIPLQVQHDSTITLYQGIAEFDSLQNLVLNSRIFQFNYQGDTINSVFLRATASQDSNSVWIGGQIQLQGHLKGAITHLQLDSNFTTISEIPLLDGTKRLFPLSQQPTVQNECLVAGLSSVTTEFGTEHDQVFVSKVNDTGVVWLKTYGHPWFADGTPFVFKGPTDTTFWFVYGKALGIDSLAPGTASPTIHLQAILLSSSGIELENRPITRNWMFSYGQIGIQLADGSIILAYYQYRYNQGYHAVFLKYSINMDLLWQSEPPLPYDAAAAGLYPSINPLGISQTPDGGFICTGEYDKNGNPPKMWLGKMDGDGCWDVGCSTVFTNIVTPKEPQKEGFLSVFPNPASDNTRVAWNEPLTHDALLQLTNSIGQTVRTIEVEKGGIYKEINLKGLAAGVYFLSLSNGETVKLVKIE